MSYMEHLAEIEKLGQLKKSGALTFEEFRVRKRGALRRATAYLIEESQNSKPDEDSDVVGLDDVAEFVVDFIGD